MGGDADIAGDEEHRGVVLPHQRAQQVEHLGLHRHVEAAGGIVRDHELGRADQRDRHHHPLRHAAAELVREGAEAPRRIGNVHRLQHVERHGVGLGAADVEVGAGDSGDLLAHGDQRVELAARVGDHHGDVPAAYRAQLVLRERPHVLAVEADRAAVDAPRLSQQPHHGTGERGLARARLAHQPDDLAGAHAEVEIPHRAHRFLLIDRVGDVEAGDIEHRHARRARLRCRGRPGCGGGHPQPLIRGSMAK